MTTSYYFNGTLGHTYNGAPVSFDNRPPLLAIGEDCEVIRRCPSCDGYGNARKRNAPCPKCGGNLVVEMPRKWGIMCLKANIGSFINRTTEHALDGEQILPSDILVMRTAEMCRDLARLIGSEGIKTFLRDEHRRDMSGVYGPRGTAFHRDAVVAVCRAGEILRRREA